MRKRGSNKESKWSSKGDGMSKHRRSGTPHNHKVSLQRTREENERLEKERGLREKRKTPNQSIRDLFKGYN